MAISFKHNGNQYATYKIILEGDYYHCPDTDNEVCLEELCDCGGETYIPKYAEYNGKKYRVTCTRHPDIPISKTYNINANDRRKKPVYKTVHDYDSRSNIRRKRRFWDCWEKGEKEEKITSIILPDSITCIGKDSFANFVALKRVVIPSSVTRIATCAFERCIELEELTIPDSVEYIDPGAFKYCKKIKHVAIPDSVKELNIRSFLGCSSLTTVTIGSGITMIGERAFAECDNLTEINIYADPFEVMIAPNAFPATAKVNYLGKKAPKKENESKKTAQPSTIDIDKLIKAVVVDGVITDKERAVILKKATAAGYDADEVEILLDGRLYEMQTVQKQTEKKKSAEEPVKANISKPTKEVTPKVTDDSTIEWSELLWEPVKDELLKQVKVKLSIPKGKPYVILASENYKGLLQYILQYSVRDGEAIVRLETYGGEDAKGQFDAKIAASPAGHPLKQAVVSQGQKNKDKWSWTIAIKADKSDTGLVKWYAETLLAAYAFMEEKTL